MFGFSRPVPITMRMSPRKNAGCAKIAESPIDRCPSAISTPPQKIERRRPSQRSAIHPPGSDARYTDDA